MINFEYQIDKQNKLQEPQTTVEINIIDAICGAGKTSAAVNMINNSDNSQKFMYITP